MVAFATGLGSASLLVTVSVMAFSKSTAKAVAGIMPNTITATSSNARNRSAALFLCLLMFSYAPFHMFVISNKVSIVRTIQNTVQIE
jgi:hypothetical protein